MQRASSAALARHWVPERSLLSDAGLVIAFSLFTGLMAHIAIPLPFTPVPITGQTFAVLLCGAVLGARLAAPGATTYGYLAGFVAAALIVGWFADLGWTKDLPRTIVAMIAGEVAIYFFGLLWLAHFVPPTKVLDFGLYPFLIGDAIKLVAAAVVVPAGWRLSRDR